MNVLLTPTALADLREIKAYLEPRNSIGCARILGAIDATLGYLETLPLIGVDGIVRGTRERVIPGTNYVIVYEIFNETELYVLRVRHTKMRWPPN